MNSSDVSMKSIIPFFTFEDLWDNEEFADVIFYVGFEANLWRIPANKLILSKFSPIFEKIFKENVEYSIGCYRNQEKEETEEILIANVKPDIFNHLLSYLYTRDFKICNLDDAFDFHKIAHEYKITDAVNVSIRYLADNITPKNVFYIYSRIEKYMDEVETLPLQLKCAQIIDTNADEAFKSNSVVNLNPDTLFEITKRSTLQISSEMILFEALLRWAMTECKKLYLALTNENKRWVLRDILFNARFGLLDEIQIWNGPLKYGIIKNDDRKNFSSIPRLRGSFSVCRLMGNMIYQEVEKSQEHSISFFFDRNVLLTGVLLMADKPSLVKNECFLIIKTDKKTLLDIRINEFNSYSRDKSTTLIELPYPVNVKPEQKYVLYAWLPSVREQIILVDNANSVTTWHDGTRECKVFWQDCCLESGCPNCTTMESGQIFELHFMLPLREDSIVSRLQELSIEAKFI